MLLLTNHVIRSWNLANGVATQTLVDVELACSVAIKNVLERSRMSIEKEFVLLGVVVLVC